VEPLRVNTEQADRTIRLTVEGELDIASAARLEEALAEAEKGEPELIVLDLRGLQFMDSTGLRTILSADSRAREAGRRLVVVQGDENVKRVFEVTRLYDRVEIVDDPAEAESGG
jgi:anti-sigma B factor antagonist